MILDDIKSVYRIGIGTDIHAISNERPLMLGGVLIPNTPGLAGHSDADVVLHALIDALLGAAGMGDIGTLFPDTDPQFKDADSRGLLMGVRDRLAGKKWEIVNIDITVHLEKPRLGQMKGQMRRCISGLLDIEFMNVNIKAKTNEGFDAVGQGDAMAATAIVLIRQKPKRTL